MKRLVRLSLLALAAMPIAIIATLVLTPFWRWLEDAAGIESFGHSGPASWCYLSVYALLCLGAIVFERRASRRRRPV